METDEYYAVFKLDSISPAGIASFDDVRTQVFSAMIKDNETEVAAAFSSELKTKLDNGANLESLKDAIPAGDIESSLKTA
jgi:hypothetical protein